MGRIKIKSPTRVFMALLLVTAICLLNACLSTIPFSAPVNSAVLNNFEVLGRVTLEVPEGDNGFLKLLKVAGEKFENCDDVINIVVDLKQTRFLIFHSNRYLLSGIAIHYLDKKR